MLFLRHDRAEQAYVAMFTACAAYGKFPSMDGICDHTLMEKFIRLSIRFLLGGDDVALMMAAAKARTAFLKSLPLPRSETSRNGAHQHEVARPS